MREYVHKPTLPNLAYFLKEGKCASFQLFFRRIAFSDKCEPDLLVTENPRNENLSFQRNQVDRGLSSDRENGRPVSPSAQLREVFALHQHDRQHRQLAGVQVPQDLVPRPQRHQASSRHRGRL